MWSSSNAKRRGKGALIHFDFQEFKALTPGFLTILTRICNNSKAYQKVKAISTTELQGCRAHLTERPRKHKDLGMRASHRAWDKGGFSSASSAEFGMWLCQAAWWTMGVTQVQPTFMSIFSNLKELEQPLGSLRRTRISCWMGTEFMEPSSFPWALIQPECLHWASAISEGNRSGSRVMLKEKTKGKARC